MGLINQQKDKLTGDNVKNAEYCYNYIDLKDPKGKLLQGKAVLTDIELAKKLY